MINHTYRIDFIYTGEERHGGEMIRLAQSKEQVANLFMSEYQQWFLKEYGYHFEPSLLDIKATEIIDKDITLKEMYYLIIELSTHGNTPELRNQATDVIAKYLSYFTQEDASK